MDLQASVELFIERMQRMMQPPAADASHGMLRGMHVIENINGKDPTFFSCLQQGRIIRNPEILPEPVNECVFLHGSRQVEDKKFTAFSGKQGDVLFFTEGRTVAGLNVGAVHIQPALDKLNPEMPIRLSGILQ